MFQRKRFDLTRIQTKFLHQMSNTNIIITQHHVSEEALCRGPGHVAGMLF